MIKWFRADLLLSLAGFIVIRMGLINYHPGLYMTGVAIFICGFPLTEIERLKKAEQRKIDFRCMFPNDYHMCESDECNPDLDCPVHRLMTELEAVAEKNQDKKEKIEAIIKLVNEYRLSEDHTLARAHIALYKIDMDILSVEYENSIYSKNG